MITARYTVTERLRRKLCHEAWNIGVIDQPAADIVRRGIVGPVRWLATPPAGTMLADPSCQMLASGGRRLFAEYLDYRRPRGEIWSAEIAPGADPAEARFHPMLAEPFHMSYPFPVEDDDGRSLLTAETWQAEATLLWSDQMGAWRRQGTLLDGRRAIDPTLWRGADRWWLFCTFRDDDPDARLHLFHADRLDGPWTAHRGNPVKVDAAASRPAGPIFAAGDLLIRPAQDCARTYGGGVVLHAIRRLDETAFEEVAVRRLSPVAAAYPHGLHTFCPAGDVTLIDGKRWRPDPIGLARKLRRRITSPSG